LQGRVQILENQLAAAGGNTGGSCCAKPVAFLAQYNDFTAVGIANGPYVFDTAVLNTGNAYDTTTGIFTAPVSGHYILILQLFSNQAGDMEHPIVDIKVNGDVLARLGFEETPNEEDSDSTTVVAHLTAGDQVFVQSDEGDEYHFWGKFHSFFSGMLVSADTY